MRFLIKFFETSRQLKSSHRTFSFYRRFVDLLEKSRVVFQIPGERNFHIFYQLFTGASSAEKDQWKLTSPERFNYMNKGNCYTVDGIKDGQDFAETKAP